MKHQLKILPEYYEQVIEGNKTFEIRKNDRNFRSGDMLHLREWDSQEKQYTTRFAECLVRFCFYGGRYGLQKGFVCMSIEVKLIHELKEV